MSNEFNAVEQARAALSGLSVTPDVSSVKPVQPKSPTSADYSEEDLAAGTRRLLSDLGKQVPSFESQGVANMRPSFGVMSTMMYRLGRMNIDGKNQTVAMASDIEANPEAFPDWLKDAGHDSRQFSQSNAMLSSAGNGLAITLARKAPDFAKSIRDMDYDTARETCEPFVEQFMALKDDMIYPRAMDMAVDNQLHDIGYSQPQPAMTAEAWLNKALVHQFSMAQRRPASMAFGGHQHLQVCLPGTSKGFEHYDSYPSWYSEVDMQPHGGLSKDAMAVRDIADSLSNRMCQINPAFVSDVKNAPTLMEAERRCMPLTTYAVSQYKTMSKQSNMTPYAMADSIAKDAAALRYEDAYFVQDMIKMEGPVEPADPGYMTHKMFDAGDLRAGRMRARSLMIVCPALKQYDPDGTFAKKADVVKEAPLQTDVKKKSGFYHSVKERLFSGRKQGLNEVEQPSKQAEADSEFY